MDSLGVGKYDISILDFFDQKSIIFDVFFINLALLFEESANFSRAGGGCTKSEKFENRQKSPKNGLNYHISQWDQVIPCIGVAGAISRIHKI